MKYKCFIVIVVVVNDTATTEIYTYVHTLSLHDALPISRRTSRRGARSGQHQAAGRPSRTWPRADTHSPRGLRPGLSRTRHYSDTVRQSGGDRKSTRLNSSH